MGRKKQYNVCLTEEERNYLTDLLAGGTQQVRKTKRIQILLKADDNWTDQQIADAIGIGRATSERTRKRYVEHGLEVAINGKKSNRVYERKMDGEVEARLIALATSAPPDGRERWTLRLLADKLVMLEGVPYDNISYETIRRTLKKNELKPWQKKEWVIPPEENAAFVCAMEEILDLYQKPYDETEPLVCFDESSKQLIAEIRKPIPMKPGEPQRFDTAYKRNGTVNMFMFFEPLGNWRHVDVTERRTKIDFAHRMKALVDDFFPDAKLIHVVMDNLNTHKLASLYEAFPAPEAHRIARRLQFHYTPKHGSWLNMAEIELSILSRQCLSQRIPEKQVLENKVEAWQAERNNSGATINWRFTTKDARIKLKRLYPSFDV